MGRATRGGGLAADGRVLAVLGRRKANAVHSMSASIPFAARAPHDRCVCRMCETSRRPKPEREILLARPRRRFGK
jgi:hypothetical protein